MRTASIIGVVPSDKGIIACQCGNSIENHNKLKISVKTCPKCNPQLEIREEKNWVLFNPNLGKTGRHVNLKGIFRFFCLNDGMNILFDKQIISQKVKLY